MSTVAGMDFRVIVLSQKNAAFLEMLAALPTNKNWFADQIKNCEIFFFLLLGT